MSQSFSNASEMELGHMNHDQTENESVQSGHSTTDTAAGFAEDGQSEDGNYAEGGRFENLCVAKVRLIIS